MCVGRRREGRGCGCGLGGTIIPKVLEIEFIIEDIPISSGRGLALLYH